MRTILWKWAILLITFTLPATAQEKPGELVKMHLGLGGMSDRVFRGVETYPNLNFLIGPSFTFFNHWELRGPNILYKSSRRKVLSYSVGIKLVDDNRPWFRIHKFEKGDIRSSRPQTYEAHGHVRYGFGHKKRSFVKLELNKDIKEHHGEFLDVEIGVPVFIFTSAVIGGGFGSKEMSTYIYGEGAKEGLAYSKFSLRHMNPLIIDDGIVLIDLTATSIYGNDKRRTSLVRDKAENYRLNLMFIWNFNLL